MTLLIGEEVELLFEETDRVRYLELEVLERRFALDDGLVKEHTRKHRKIFEIGVAARLKADLLQSFFPFVLLHLERED